MSALGGVLAAAMVLPVVAATGILVRNTADKFTTLSAPSGSGLPQRSEIFDRLGHLITYVYGVDLGPHMSYTGLDRQPVSYSQISPNMLKAIVAIEDDRFWQRGALDVKGTLRALVNDLEHKPIQGGSTIEQQYVKGVLVLQGLGNSTAEQAAIADTLSRKLNQLEMAVQVAHTMSKQQILDGYLNDAFYGSGAWGIEAAAETYFGTTAAKLSLVQAATLAGIVENPSQYDPLANPAVSLERRNTVLARMEQTGVLSPAAEAAALKQKLVVNSRPAQSGCNASTVGNDAFFCDYVIHSVLLSKQFGATTQDRAKLLATGGLRIYTTLAPQDQSAATNAVNFVLPAQSNYYNPAHNADTEVLMQPGTGDVLAIAEDRPYGTGKGQTEVDYAVNQQYGGTSVGVQTGSSSKLFILITALEQGIPFGFQLTVPGSTVIGGYRNCQGQLTGVVQGHNGEGWFQVENAEGPGASTQTLYTGTTNSINVFFAELEQKVGLCNAVETAVKLGMTRADGTSLLAYDHTPLGTLQPADDYPAFTLGVVGVSPMSMAAAYSTVASGGIYCKPIAIAKVVDAAGRKIPVPSAGCHRVISTEVANAVNYVLQGVITHGTAANVGGITGYQTAGKTGTSNVTTGNGTPYAAFAGYSSNLVSYSSVFNPVSPTTDTMAYQTACYRLEFGGAACPNEMYGANAPASTWHMTFDHANLSGSANFALPPSTSKLWSQGNGQAIKPPPKPKPKKGGHGGGGTGGGGTGGGGTGGGGAGGGGGNGGGGTGPPHG